MVARSAAAGVAQLNRTSLLLTNCGEIGNSSFRIFIAISRIEAVRYCPGMA